MESEQKLMPIEEVEEKQPEEKDEKKEEEFRKNIMSNTLSQKTLSSLAVFNNLYSGA